MTQIPSAVRNSPTHCTILCVAAESGNRRPVLPREECRGNPLTKVPCGGNGGSRLGQSASRQL